jgi:hypothetical protein
VSLGIGFTLCAEKEICITVTREILSCAANMLFQTTKWIGEFATAISNMRDRRALGAMTDLTVGTSFRPENFIIVFNAKDELTTWQRIIDATMPMIVGENKCNSVGHCLIFVREFAVPMTQLLMIFMCD